MRKNRIVRGGVHTMAKGGKTTATLNLIIENEPAVIYLPLEELIALRNNINDSLNNYIRRMEAIKEEVRKHSRRLKKEK